MLYLIHKVSYSSIIKSFIDSDLMSTLIYSIKAAKKTISSFCLNFRNWGFTPQEYSVTFGFHCYFFNYEILLVITLPFPVIKMNLIILVLLFCHTYMDSFTSLKA